MVRTYSNVHGPVLSRDLLAPRPAGHPLICVPHVDTDTGHPMLTQWPALGEVKPPCPSGFLSLFSISHQTCVLIENVSQKYV